jgi:hypothetical protein
MLTVEQWQTLTQAILANPADIAIVSKNLADLTDEFTELSTAKQKLTDDNKTLTENMEKIRAVNMDLFLKVGAKPTTPNNDGTQPGSSGRKPIDFESLFDDKGKLK